MENSASHSITKSLREFRKRSKSENPSISKPFSDLSNVFNYNTDNNVAESLCEFREPPKSVTKSLREFRKGSKSQNPSTSKPLSDLSRVFNYNSDNNVAESLREFREPPKSVTKSLREFRKRSKSQNPTTCKLVSDSSNVCNYNSDNNLAESLCEPKKWCRSENPSSFQPLINLLNGAYDAVNFDLPVNYEDNNNYNSDSNFISNNHNNNETNMDYNTVNFCSTSNSEGEYEYQAPIDFVRENYVSDDLKTKDSETVNVSNTCNNAGEEKMPKKNDFGSGNYVPKELKIAIHNLANRLTEEKLEKHKIVSRISELLKISTHLIRIILSKEPLSPQKRGKKAGKQLRKLDAETKEDIRKIVYSFYGRNLIPTLDMVYKEVKEQLKEKFPYKKTSFQKVLIACGFKYKKYERRSFIMESSRLKAWREKYLETIEKYRKEGRNIIYLDETWFDTHDISPKGWTDGSKECVAELPASRGKRLIIVHAGGEDGFVPNALFIASKYVQHASADYHSDMNGEVFEDWFKHWLLPNIKGKNCIIVMDNASYHSRLKVKVPNMRTLKADIVAFMKEHNVPIPDGKLPKKKTLLEIIAAHNITKKYIVDEMAAEEGHTVERLPPYHCIFNPIESVWSNLKVNLRRRNSCPKDSDRVILELRKIASEISPELWKKYVNRVKKEEDAYRKVISNSDSSELLIEEPALNDESEPPEDDNEFIWDFENFNFDEEEFEDSEDDEGNDD